MALNLLNRRLNFSLTKQLIITRNTSNGSFVQNLLNKIREESNKDKQMKESVRKFREETEKLEKSKEIQSMRDFYQKIEKELPTDAMDKLRGQVQSVAQKIKDERDKMSKNEYVRKGIDGISKAGENIIDASRYLGDSEILKAAKNGVAAVDKELQSDRALMYKPPAKPQTRKEVAGTASERIIEANMEASGVVIHKDSKWIAAWQDFKDNSQYAQKFFDLRARYEESEHVVARSLRFVTDKMSQLFGSKGSSNELQLVLDEVTKIDPTFTLEEFVRYCRLDIIPNVLEAIVHGDMVVLQDWCHEGPYNVLAAPIKQVKELGLNLDSHVLDINNIDVQMGKMMEQGPVLIITFQAQQISCVRDKRGLIKEGDPEKVLRVTHVWALCRDQSELHPLSAWRILDVAMMPTEQWL